MGESMKLLEELFLIAFALFVITQILIPVLFNRPLFSLFRRTSKDDMIEKARQRVEEQEKALELARLKLKEQELRHESETLGETKKEGTES